jgi:Rrf2 family protein
MLITRETDYALRCVLYLARTGKKVASVGEIAANMDIPKSFLAKILQRLVREGLVESSRGASGGFWLVRNPEHITILEVMTAMQGVTPINTCAVDKHRCRSSAHCTVHPIWTEIRTEVERRLALQTIAGMI